MGEFRGGKDWNTKEYDKNGKTLGKIVSGKGPSQNETIKTVNYDTNIMELCREYIVGKWNSYMGINKKSLTLKDIYLLLWEKMVVVNMV